MSEICREINSEVKDYEITSITQQEVIELLQESKLSGTKINNEWYSCKLDVSFLIDLLNNKERYLRVKYGGAIGIDMSHVELNGRILDIGGGGEGIIGDLKGDAVIAIDSSKRELEEAPHGGLKIQMDAKDLKFLDNTFDTVTSFYTLMYVPYFDHKKVFEEIYRVLKPSGEFIMWDIDIPKNIKNEKDLYSVRLEVLLCNKTVFTGYGTKWGKKGQSLDYFQKLGKSIGFKVTTSDILSDKSYMIKLKK